MLIGLDAIPLTEPLTGVGHYTLELARAIASASPADEFELVYPSRYPPIDLSLARVPMPPNLRASRVRVGLLGARWWLVGLPRHARRRGFALFHGTNYEVPLRAACPTVLTVHDLSAFTHPETHVARRARRLRLRLPAMARAATHVVTPTEAVRREACEWLKLDPSKVTAIREAPREVFCPLARSEAEATLRRLGIAGDFILFVGTVEPRKNLATLVSAFEKLATDGQIAGVSNAARAPSAAATRSSFPRLVIAGRQGWLTRPLSARIEASPARAHIHFTGYVSDEELRVLYASCLAFVYPSVYEGFGLPPLEAMSCGAAVIASRIPAHLETLGEENALFVAPGDADGLARALSELIGDEDLRHGLARSGQRRAAEFTWANAARLTLKVYERALTEWAAKKV
ncbi:MAG: glycosyltransferase family 4 protein [Pyrinomonadaceae bacterium]